MHDLICQSDRSVMAAAGDKYTCALCGSEYPIRDGVVLSLDARANRDAVELPADRQALGDSLDGWTAGDGHQHLARQARRAHPPLDRGYDTETRLGGVEQRTAGVDDLEARSLERDPRRGVLSFHHSTQPEEPQRPEGVPGEAAEGSRPNTAAPPLRRDVNADGRVLVLDVEPHHAGVDAVYAHDE